jgi:hypothetical protein
MELVARKWLKGVLFFSSLENGAFHEFGAKIT